MAFETRPCSTCGAQIVWCVSAAGRPIPMDPEPHEKGNRVIVLEAPDPDNRGHQILRSRAPDLLLEAGRPLYRAHFATCPQADAHRRRRRKRG